MLRGGWRRSPQGHRRLAKRVVAGHLLARHAAFDALLHALAHLAGLHQLHVESLHMPEVEEVALPVELSAARVAEPAAADAVDFLLGALGIRRHLLPESD